VAKKGHSEEQILGRIATGGRRYQSGRYLPGEHRISEATYYIWKTRCSVQGLSELREPRQLRGADGVCAQHAAGVGVGD
jgi:hypothetical protein